MEKHEPEFRGKTILHPYVLYIALTAVIFAVLIIVGVIAFKSGVIPQ